MIWYYGLLITIIITSRVVHSDLALCSNCQDCNGAQDISIAPNVTIIAPYAFQFCTSISTVLIPT